MTLMGAEVLLYPTAIGSEPHDPEPRHRRSHGAAPCRATRFPTSSRWSAPTAPDSSRGPEYPGGGQRFYGSSFVADHRGDLVADLGRDGEGIAAATFDLDFLATHRAAWGFFRDRRPDLYRVLAEPRPE